MKRSECLDIANKIVNGERQQAYGTPEHNFNRIAEMWTAYLQNRDEERLDYITAKDVSVMMMLLKIARIMSGTSTQDSWIDICGYAACGCEIETEE